MTQQNNSGKSNRVSVPEAKAALDNMKYEIANELGVNLKQGYNGDLSSREAGYVGGYMVKKMIEDYEKQMSGKYCRGRSRKGCKRVNFIRRKDPLAPAANESFLSVKNKKANPNDPPFV